MSRKIFRIEYDDELGPEWLNIDNLKLCLFSDSHISSIRVDVKDITSDLDDLLNTLVKTFNFSQ